MAVILLQTPDLLRMAAQAICLLLTFIGAGLYCRGLYAYFRTLRWWHRAEQAQIRKRYKCSAIAAILREPALSTVKSQLLMSLAGPVVFAVGGTFYNILQRAA